MSEETKEVAADSGSESYNGAPILVTDDGLEYQEITIKHGGKSRSFRVSEVDYTKLQSIKAKLNKQDEAQKEQALAGFGGWLIAICCTENGEKVDPSKLSSRIGSRLEKACMFLNGMGEDAETRAKNE